jgi:hypothetical protein
MQSCLENFGVWFPERIETSVTVLSLGEMDARRDAQRPPPERIEPSVTLLSLGEVARRDAQRPPPPGKRRRTPKEKKEREDARVQAFFQALNEDPDKYNFLQEEEEEVDYHNDDPREIDYHDDDPRPSISSTGASSFSATRETERGSGAMSANWACGASPAEAQEINEMMDHDARQSFVRKVSDALLRFRDQQPDDDIEEQHPHYIMRCHYGRTQFLMKLGAWNCERILYEGEWLPPGTDRAMHKRQRLRVMTADRSAWYRGQHQQADRATVGHMVLIQSTRWTKAYCPKLIGQMVKIVQDDKDSRPYQVEGCAIHLYEDDVRKQDRRRAFATT